MAARKRRSGFSILSGTITKEYEGKGYSKKRASKIGHATAGKIARGKRRK
jgi:hypothetical protein